MSPEEFTQAIKEFKEVYKEVNGTELDDESASEMANDLLQFFINLLQIE